MPLYDYPRDKNPEAVLSPYMRRPFGPTDPTVAMHWDGTYRDRVVGVDRRFWPEISGFNPRPARGIAKHLA